MYTPKLSEYQIRELYQLKLKVNRPMTHLLRDAVNDYLNKQRKEEKINERRS